MNMTLRGGSCLGKILTSRYRNCTANATGDYASAIGNNYVIISDFTVENATSNLGWAVGNENNSQKGITLNTKCSYNKLDSEQQQLPGQHGQNLSTQRVHDTHPRSLHSHPLHIDPHGVHTLLLRGPRDTF